MNARPLAGLAAAALILAAFPVPSPAADEAVVSPESLAKFRSLFDPDVPPAFRDDAPALRAPHGGPRAAVAPHASAGGSWWPGFAAGPAGQGLQSSVNAMLEWGGTLVVAGDFTKAGGEPMYRVAAWNGSSWTSLGLGMNHRVFALEEYEGDLVAGGAFTLADGVTANFVARWDGASWSPMDLGTGGPVYTLEVHEGVLYAGGDFRDFLRRWDGTRWQPLPVPPNGPVAALLSTDATGFGPTLFAGGIMTTWGNQGSGTGTYIFRKTGASDTFFRLNGGSNDWVSALHVVNDTLYVGGNFISVRNLGNALLMSSKIVGLAFVSNRPTFFPLGYGDATDSQNGVDDAVLAITDLAGAVVVGGQFDTATNDGGGQVVANRVASWTPVGWAALGNGLSSGVAEPHVRALAKFGGDLYAGGWFTHAGGVGSRHIARWLDTPAPAIDATSAVPAGASLAVRVSPNPFTHGTEVSFASPAPASVELTVHDVTGRRVRTLLSADGVEGVRTARWDGRDAEGRPLASGVYFVRLERDGVVASRQVVLTR